MDLQYWQTRCAAAEEALRRARTGLVMSDQRKRAIALLADLRPGETLTTIQVADSLCVPENQAFAVLNGMDGIGLVDRARGRRGPQGDPSRWKLAHMVQVAEPA